MFLIYLHVSYQQVVDASGVVFACYTRCIFCVESSAVSNPSEFKGGKLKRLKDKRQQDKDLAPVSSTPLGIMTTTPSSRISSVSATLFLLIMFSVDKAMISLCCTSAHRLINILCFKESSVLVQVNIYINEHLTTNSKQPNVLYFILYSCSRFHPAFVTVKTNNYIGY